MWELVDLQELRVFLTLADERHFGRTAERLGVSSSRVSQLLRSLERKLGGELVHRTSRRVELTSFGEEFRRDACDAYAHVTGVLKRAEESRRGVRGTLSVSAFSDAAAGPHLLSIVDEFERRFPQCTVDVRQARPLELLDGLRCGEADLLAMWLPIDERDVIIGPVLTAEPRVVAVSETHPLARRDSVSIEEAAEYPMPRYRGEPTSFYETWIPSTTPAGRPVERVAVGTPDRVTDLAIAIRRGHLVHPTVPSAVPLLGHGIVAVPIIDLPVWQSALAWRRGNADEKVRAFVAVARELLDNAQGAIPQ